MSNFPLTPEDCREIEFWKALHECPYYDDGNNPVSPQGAIGGVLTYSFTPTGLGTVIKVSCACGSVLDLTDYDSW